MISNLEIKHDGASLFAEMQELDLNVRQHMPNVKLIGSFEEHAETMIAYEQMPENIRQKIFDDFVNYSEILTSSLDSNIGEYSDQRLLWSVIKKLNLSFEGDLFSSIGPGDVIEVYRNDGIQVFRNFKFHEICSYHYPELFTKTWDQLFERDPFFTKQIQSAGMSIFSGEILGKFDLSHIKTHEIKEIDSPKSFRMLMQQKFLYPLFNKKQESEYAVAVSKVELVDQPIANLQL